MNSLQISRQIANTFNLNLFEDELRAHLQSSGIKRIPQNWRDYERAKLLLESAPGSVAYMRGIVVIADWVGV